MFLGEINICRLFVYFAKLAFSLLKYPRTFIGRSLDIHERNPVHCLVGLDRNLLLISINFFSLDFLLLLLQHLVSFPFAVAKHGTRSLKTDILLLGLFQDPSQLDKILVRLYFLFTDDNFTLR